MKKRKTGKRKGRQAEYRQIGTGTQRLDEIVYTSAFRTRQKFGAASPVRHIPVDQVDEDSAKTLTVSPSHAKGETVVRCDCGHEVSEADFISRLQAPNSINSLADFHLIAKKLRCNACKQRGKARVLFKICY